MHPDAPSGGGGRGHFVEARPIGSGASADQTALPHPRSPAGRRLTLDEISAADRGASAGDSDISVALPRQGVGFKAYKTQQTQYGYKQTIDFIEDVAHRWSQRYPNGPRLLIGDLAVEGGGRTPKQWGYPERGYHLSHGSGLDFDVQIIRTDGIESPRSVQVTDQEPSKYDRSRTLELVRIMHELGANSLKMILSADRALNTPFTQKVRYDGTHTYHLHVRLVRRPETTERIP